MTKMILKSLVILSLFAGANSFAAGFSVKAADVKTSDELNDKMTKDIKDGQDAIKADAAYAESIRNNATADLAKLSGGQLDTQAFNAALNSNVTMTVNGKTVKLNLLGIAQSIRDAKASMDAANTQSLDAAGKADLSAKQALVKTSSQFMSLLANMDSAAVDARYVNALVSEIATIQILLAKGTAADINSHLELMQGALQHQAQNPAMTGNAAFKAALVDKFGADKADQKADDLNGCQRDVLF